MRLICLTVSAPNVLLKHIFTCSVNTLCLYKCGLHIYAKKNHLSVHLLFQYKLFSLKYVIKESKNCTLTQNPYLKDRVDSIYLLVQFFCWLKTIGNHWTWFVPHLLVKNKQQVLKKFIMLSDSYQRKQNWVWKRNWCV